LVSNMSTLTSHRPLISVIIPTYNRALLLRRAIDSVFAQEALGQEFDIEVLVIDDGSTDTTAAVASSYPQLRYMRPSRNKGTSGARNVGLDVAAGEYVAFLDDDDSWLPWKLRRQMQALEEREEVSLVYGQEIKRSDGAVWVWPDPQDSPSGWIYRSLLLTCPVNTSSVLIRRSHLDRAGRFDESLRCWEDYDMWLRLAFQGPFRFLPGPAVIYQVASSGRFLSSVLTGESERDLRNIVNAALERLRSKEEVSDDFRAHVETGVVTRISGQLLALQESSVLRTYLLRAVREAPWLVGMTELRWMLSTAAVSTGAVPDLDGVRDFCAQIKAACAGGGPRQWTATRRLEAEIWRKVAVALAAAPQGPHRQAVRAAVRSVSQHPATLGRGVLRIFAGAVH
jgi:glycosyltransferase involved in cell wall biosynthesis